MQQLIFTSPSNATENTTIPKLRPRKGVIIGTGKVGLACAYSLSLGLSLIAVPASFFQLFASTSIS